GSVGLLPALGIVVLANAVTLITALSVSAVVTNMRVGKGGAYYIISRSLGIEVGAAVGIPLFLAMAFSVTLYAFGLAESITVVWPEAPERPIAAVTVLAVALLAARGAGVALRLQLPIMAGIVLSLIALAVGALGEASVTDARLVAPEAGTDFWVVFAVFFPAVTGIMAGISLSGDLEKPHRAIPLGTIAAVLVGFVVYLTVPVLLAGAATPEQLLTDNLIWFDLAGPLSFLVLWGLWGAI
ncbi:MAG: Na-K-Cl cotransporter, partial [Gemmatimonadetes bacterium]|nr:Na-K-Cl cotransporter [Gemmatimonadota bacterium]NIU71699.1 Na-K-Cl cotransporter [Actinomycetota bacterium]NIQ60064.1 Na-K-Cl cotransporter [Gemmatimonadota bacterium]NIV91006.1 Na-K-Cl cotransporter [Actinomycetota bacterium]NIX48652.1 Na-K-Cl cotransporter [Gemmatimonadota bacterium]